MELAKIMSLLNSSGFIPTIRYYKYVMDAKTTPCASCLRFAGEIFAENDVNIPSLPRHPNCDCFLLMSIKRNISNRKILNSEK